MAITCSERHLWNCRLEAQPACFSEEFKNSLTGGCGERNTGPQLALCWDNSHSYSLTIHASGVQALLSVKLNKPCSFLPGVWRRGSEGRQGHGQAHGGRGEDSWWHNGCPGQAALALPSLAHLLPCSWFNRQEAQPKTPGPSRQRFLPAWPGLSPRTGQGRLWGTQTLGRLLKKQKERKKMKQIRPTCRKPARWMDKETNRSSVLKCSPRRPPKQCTKHWWHILI